jgi:hypothetical protein
MFTRFSDQESMMSSTFLKSVAIAFVGVFGLAFSAQAATIQLNPGNTIDGSGYGPSNCEPECIFEVFGLAPETDLKLFYKADENDPNTIYSGIFADSYTTTFDNAPNNPTDAVIEYIVGQLAMNCSGGCYLAIKDGTATPGYYFYDLTGWNGTDSIEMTGFWFGTQGAISHVSIWGVDPPEFDVAEPATLGLLGLSLLGFGLARRRRS